MTNNQKIHSITAIERDGMYVRTLSMQFEVTECSRGLKQAIRDACKEYVTTTADGQAEYENNCRCFNWADFWSNVPNTICEKYGFRKMTEILSADDVNWDEQLVDENDAE